MRSLFGFAVECPAFLAILVSGQLNNVCDNYVDYATLPINPKCWYNPDVERGGPELIRGHGYEFVNYKVQTEDGYINNLFRIPSDGQPIILHHGVFVSSDVWSDTGPRSLAFYLSRQGYDVWIANSRGSTYAQEHVEYTIYNPKYWNFSFHEIGIYDVPSNLETVKRHTDKKPIFLGHSMGTTVAFVYMAEMPEHAEEHMKGVVALAPVAYLKDTLCIAAVLVPFRKPLGVLLTVLLQGGLAKTALIRDTLRTLCSTYPLIRLCEILLFLGFGFDFEQLTSESVTLLFGHAPAGASVKTILHYAQEVANEGKFQKFDYGKRTNLRIYGSRQPPEYDIKRFPFCVHLIYGKFDYIADPKDVERLHRNLNCSTVDKVPPDDDPPFNHIDFVYAKNVMRLLYPTLMKRIRNAN